jgi:hypothetical protein
MSELNRNKPYGEVGGLGIAHKYEQDGKLFDADGKEMTAKQVAKRSEEIAADDRAAKEAEAKQAFEQLTPEQQAAAKQVAAQAS